MSRTIIALVIAIILVVSGAVAWSMLRSAPEDNVTVIPPTDCNGPGDSCPNGYTCIQECGPPVVSDMDPLPGYYCEQDAIANQPRNCPICLASNTRISTPVGEISVTDIHVGTMVWTEDAGGNRVAMPVIKIGRTKAPTNHHMVDLKLSDGREVFVSPNHPFEDGREAALAKSGDVYDGAIIVSVKLTKYWDAFTYDLLPAGSTGLYWGNGVPLKSTLD